MPSSHQILGAMKPGFAEILTPEAIAFVVAISDKFESRRRELLAAREVRWQQLLAGVLPDFLPETKHVRDGDWRVAPIPPALADRRAEITGPTERKMLINALNCGAPMFMADLEDSNSPTWDNVIGGQINLRDAVDRTITFSNPDGKQYKLNEKTAVL
ncbi:MAG: malate synthase A, partial [Acidobacteria bacterium]|nr:malate synthase A [Acidobacteriota bacterium]